MSAATTVAFIGYGRFGRALGERLLEVGTTVRAFDPAMPPPPELAAAGPEALVDGADVVVLAVPVAATASVLEAWRSHLTPQQLVMDVGSVKSGPVAVMTRQLGRDVPWVGTHPLFGPTSLTLGERPLRAIVCPNPMHPEAARRASELYGLIGCEVVLQDPESHDRQMAESHALGYFVAKGFLDAGLRFASPHLPPSSQAIARTVEAVREDAAHLFASLHRENPYAAEARRRLLDALQVADEALRAPPVEGERAHEEAGALHIDDLGAASPQIADARDVIDAIDRDLVQLLARRAELALRAARAKARLGHGVRDPGREAALLDSRGAHAAELGLDRETVEEIFQAILRFSRLHQADAARRGEL